MEKLYQEIARTLKTLRQNRGWSLDKTAQETGVSKAMLGQIEREESSPTIATLWKIAKGFQEPFSAFITTNPQPSFAKPKILHPLDPTIRVLTLLPFDSELKFEMFMIELLPHCEHLSPAHALGVVEHVIVIEGDLEVLLEGKWRRLQTGERLRFNADQPHGYRNTTNELARFHNMIHYPR